MSIAIITDSGSGIKAEEASKKDISVVPIPIIIDGKEYRENVDIDTEEFYKKQAAGCSISTAAPPLGDILDLWEKALSENEEVVYIPLSSGLSGSCSMCRMAADDYKGRVHVIDSKRISVTQRQAVYDAVELAKKGMTGKEIRTLLQSPSYKSHIYIMVDTLKYLKAGGRVTPAAAAVASVLNIKPILQIQGDKLDAFSKCRGTKTAKRIMLEKVKDEVENEFGGIDQRSPNAWIGMAHTNNLEKALEYKKEVEAVFPGLYVYLDELSMPIAVHIGPGSLALTSAGFLPGGTKFK